MELSLEPCRRHQRHTGDSGFLRQRQHRSYLDAKSYHFYFRLLGASSLFPLTFHTHTHTHYHGGVKWETVCMFSLISLPNIIHTHRYMIYHNKISNTYIFSANVSLFTTYVDYKQICDCVRIMIWRCNVCVTLITIPFCFCKLLYALLESFM